MIINNGNYIGQLDPTGTSYQPSYIAIDDISFTIGCYISLSTLAPGQSSTTPHPLVTQINKCPSQFTCKTSGTCINNNQVCNFHNDCGDGSDELNCGTCKFDQADPTGKPSMCGWRNIGYGKKQWAVKSVKDLSVYNGLLPTMDARSNKTGRFLVIDTSQGK